MGPMLTLSRMNASMRPRSFDRGNFEAEGLKREGKGKLQ